MKAHVCACPALPCLPLPAESSELWLPLLRTLHAWSKATSHHPASYFFLVLSLWRWTAIATAPAYWNIVRGKVYVFSFHTRCNLPAQAIVENLLKEFPNVLTLRVRMPIVADLVYPRNFITKIIKYDKVASPDRAHQHPVACLRSVMMPFFCCRLMTHFYYMTNCYGPHLSASEPVSEQGLTGPQPRTLLTGFFPAGPRLLFRQEHAIVHVPCSAACTAT